MSTDNKEDDAIVEEAKHAGDLYARAIEAGTSIDGEHYYRAYADTVSRVVASRVASSRTK